MANHWYGQGCAGAPVVHTTPESDDEDDEKEESIRIISARKATPRERRIYAEGE